jgi:isopentenyl-diphosphate delta-isomerase
MFVLFVCPKVLGHFVPLIQFMMQTEQVILVDQNDAPLGTMEKMEAHEKGVLHRAFSVFVFNEKNELMLQQRAWHKYHSPGLWTNTCCSHQRMGEDSVSAGRRRLREEMGFEVPLEFKVSFIYKAPFVNGLTEHELDHVLVGHFEGAPKVNSDEVASWKWMPMDELIQDMAENPDQYTVWFKIIFDKYCENLGL